MRHLRLLLILPLLALVACDDDGVSVNPVESAALVRFINAAPQPGAVSLRFIDRVENLPNFLQVPFQGGTGAGYTRVAPGNRHLRVFPHSTDHTVAQDRLVDDPAFGLTADARYTLVLTQNGAGAHQITRLDDPASIARAPAGQIAVKVLHAAVGEGAVRVHVAPSSEVSVLADLTGEAIHVFDGVAEMSATGYANVPRLESGLYYFTVTDADDNILFFAAPDQPGEASSIPTVGPQPGVRIEESVLTVVLTANDGIAMMIDRTLDP